MIENIQLESNSGDWASLLGRGTLLAGSGYGVYQTFKGLGIDPVDRGTYRSKFADIIGRSKIQGLAPQEAAIDHTSIFSFKQHGPFFQGEEIASDVFTPFKRVSSYKNYSAIDFLSMSINQTAEGGYRGLSTELPSELKGLYSDLASRGHKPEIYARGIKQGSGQVQLRTKIDGRNVTFKVNPISKEGTTVLGSGSLETRYATRQILKDHSALAVDTVGADVALTKRYRQSLDAIFTGQTRPEDLFESIYGKTIYEEKRGLDIASEGSSGIIGKLTREQIVVDPFDELNQKALSEKMKRFLRIQGHGTGTASQFTKGILTSQASPAAMLPGAAESGTSGQLLRISKFTNRPANTISWLEGAGFSQFKVATVKNEAAKAGLERVVEQMGYKIGEIAPEEALLKANQNITVKNRLYGPKIDLSKEPTELMKRITKTIEEKLGSHDLLLSETGITDANIDLDLNKVYKDAHGEILIEQEKLKNEQRKARKKIRKIDNITRSNKDLSFKKRAKMLLERERLSGAKKEIGEQIAELKKGASDLDILGYSPDVESPVRLKSLEGKNLLTRMAIRDNKLSIATETHFNVSQGAKFFSGGGGAKVTIKKEVDLPAVLEQLEWQQKTGETSRLASKKELTETGIKNLFNEVDLLTVEAPVKLKGGKLPPREAMQAIMSYATNLSENTSVSSEEKARRLKVLGVEDGRYVGLQKGTDTADIVKQMKSWHPDESMDLILAKKMTSSVGITNALLSADISTAQSGFGGLASLSERAAYNLHGLGLDTFLEGTLDRRTAGGNVYQQFKQLEKGRQIVSDSLIKGKEIGQFADADTLASAFSDDLAVRRKFLEGDTYTVNLGKKIEGVEKVNIFASETMSPYIGKRIGGKSLAELDWATKNLISTVATNQSETTQVAAAKKYKETMKEVNKSVEGNIIKGKIKKSMYAQSVSSLEGMDEAGRALAEKMGAKGQIAPLVAMSEEDILGKFGKQALRKAKTSEGLWGAVIREPVEGIHSTAISKIMVAEDFGAKDLGTGFVYMSGQEESKSMLRKSLFVDFDKDPIHVIPATTKKQNTELLSFMMDRQNPMGEAYKKSLGRMALFDIKGVSSADITELDEFVRREVSTGTKYLEKGQIGTFSNRFKNIHLGLSEMLPKEMTRGAAERFALGEDFSHLFVENIIKAKHQRPEAIIKHEAERIFDVLLNKERGSVTERAAAMQGLFDEMVFGSDQGKQVGESIRQLDKEQIISKNLAASMGRGSEDIALASKRAAAYKEVSAAGNMENVIRAHDIGVEAQKAGTYSAQIAKEASASKSLFSRASRAVRTLDRFGGKALKNIGLWGILPTAAIGLAASMTTSPSTLTPVERMADTHEGEYEKAMSEVSLPKTVFDIPEPKMSAFQINAMASRNTDFESMLNVAKTKSMNLNISDFRAHQNKYTVEEMIERGY